MGEHRIEIERFGVTCLVAEDQPRPDRLRDRIDAAAAGIGAALGESLTPLFDAHGDGVCLVRRIDLDLAFDGDADDPRMRAEWVQAIAVAVARRLAGDGDGIVRFASHAAQLAHFLDRLAAGDAWSLWYHREYAGLCAMPDAIAARTALLADGATGLASLRLLDGWSRQRLLGVLGDAECRRVLDGLASGGAACADASLALAQALPACRCAPSQVGTAALELYVELSAASGVTPGSAEAGLVLAVAALRASTARGDTGLLDLLDGPVRGAVRAPGDAGDDMALQGLPVAERILLARAMGAAAATRAVEYTPHGGLFLLLDALDSVMPPCLDDWPDCNGEHASMPAARLLRLLVLANGLGADHAPHILEDSLWRKLFAVPAKLSLRDIAEWSAALPPPALANWARTLAAPALPAWPPAPAKVSRAIGRAAALLLRRFAVRMPDFGNAGALHLRKNFLGASARVERGDGMLTATLAPPPLDVILAMSALSAATLQLPWLTPPVVHLRRSRD